MFEFLFKYPAVVYERGEFSLAIPYWGLLVILGAAAGVVWFGLSYRRKGADLSNIDRAVLAALRAVMLAVIAFLLLRPNLIVSTVIPRKNYVAVLLDDSQSMRIEDEVGGRRRDQLLDLFGGADEGTVATQTASAQPIAETLSPGEEPAVASDDQGALRSALSERFRVRTYGFAGGVQRLNAGTGMSFSGTETDLGGALSAVHQEMESLPLSGIIIASDGAETGVGEASGLSEALLEVRASGVPVYTVGLGNERITPDLELVRVDAPRRALEGTTLVADVTLSHTGLSDRTVRLEVRNEGSTEAVEEVRLGAGGEEALQVQFTLEGSGPRRVEFTVAPEPEEALAENNSRELLIEVGDTRRDILYFEGSPRPENKFVRRAVAEDQSLRVATLLRTADEKFLRLDVEGPEELAGGFPETREELYRYDGLVLGSVEASFFTHDQLQMMADFVSERGGGLLVLGGRRAFGEGGYRGTPLADALPVVIGPQGEPEVLEVRAELTPAGLREAALRVAETSTASSERWSELPPLTSVNRIHELKTGAVPLALGVPVIGDSRVLLAYQRYGRGKSIAFTAQDSWLWQMHADVPLEDQTHETFWRQLLRWLVHEAPERLLVEVPSDVLPNGEPVQIKAEVEDERYLRVNGADVIAEVTGPSGVPSQVRMSWTVEEDGEYEGRFVPREDGLHTVEVRASLSRADGELEEIEGAAFLRVGDPQVELFRVGRRTALLERIAEETGGRFYTADEAHRLPEEIQYTESGDTVREARPLWDLPVIFLALATLLGGEWAYRRWRGLP